MGSNRKVDSWQEQMVNISKGLETLKNNQKEVTKIKVAVREMKNVHTEFMKRLDTPINKPVSLKIEQFLTLKHKERKV